VIVFGSGVLVVGLAFHVAWIGKRAEARGRFVLGWVGLGIAAALLGLRTGLVLFDRADALSSNALTALCVTAPITLAFAPMIAIVLVLLMLPTHVSIGKGWPVHEKLAGAGTLVIEKDAIELRWAQRTDRIAREGLTAEADVETLRLAWHDGATARELVLMPTGKPANREGRVRQAEVLAARLQS
jgi:hypothetical protein